MIEIIKASAGSGKTFTLAKKYIKLLLETSDRYAYRHILAVTFTNKATEEMKSRILKELHVLATEPRESDYYKEFVPEHYQDDASLQEAARTVLCNILHDYGAFAVSTIDRFFQQTLKAFSREIGHFASYQVELDKNSLIAESVDRVLDSMTDDKKDQKKLQWLTTNTLSQIEKGEGYKMDFALKNVAQRLKKEEHRILIEKEGLDEDRIYSDEELQRLSDGCKTVCQTYLTMLKDAAQKVYDAFAAVGLDPYDTSAHFMTKAVDKYMNVEEFGNVPLPTAAFIDKCNGEKGWFPRAKGYMDDVDKSGIITALNHLLSLFGAEYKVYNTALLLKAQVYGFGIANELHQEFEALLKEKNVLSLDDSNTILKNIIDGTETPFIYEKLGVRYEHFLLDEFQDTSRVQWDNFRPLLKNSVDSGFYNLIVGDVKQSIYRFRDSDWKLLRDEVSGSFGDNVVQDTLKDNWRSYGNIVRFNNSLFSAVSQVLDVKYDKKKDGVVSGIYEDVSQHIKKKGEGCVKLTFCSNEDELDAIVESIRTAVSKGYSYKDIAVLVRINKDGAQIARRLIDENIRVVTDDSLLVSSSITVRRLVSLLSSIDNPDDTMAKYLAEHLNIEIPQSYSSIIDLCEDLLRKLKAYNEDIFDSEVLYIQSFMDILRDYALKNGNSLHSFLKDWTETKAGKENISSPKVGDAVRIMTMHKSKGLDFRYVIVPFVEAIGLSKHEKKWCKPDVAGTALEGVAEGIYDVTLSGKSEQTLFSSHYKDEQLLQYVDNVNVLYVALTRARECMEVIAALPEKADAIKEIKKIEDYDIKGEDTAPDLSALDNFASILYWYANAYGGDMGMSEEFMYGEMPEAEAKDEKDDTKPLSTRFCSWPLNPEGGLEDAPVNEKGRLKFNADASDFFSEDGSAGVAASHRIKGIVLHDILAKVCVPEDVDAAVDAAVVLGTLSSEDAPMVKELFRSRISSVESRGWFPQDRRMVLNEVELVDTEGSTCRPDRVVRNGKKVIIVDYKFGGHYKTYEDKIRHYADLWRDMGYEVESAYLWYVPNGDIVPVV